MPKRDFAIPDVTEPEPPEEEEEEQEEEDEEEEEEDEETVASDARPSELFEGKPRLISKPHPARKREKKAKETANFKRDWPREPDLLWSHILAWLPTLNPPRQPSEVSIQVISMGGNVHGMMITPLEPKIRGDQVLGDQMMPPGDALMNMIIDVYHARTQGRRYKLKFYFPIGAKGHGWENIKESEDFGLDDINSINQRRMAASAYQPAAYQGVGAAPRPMPPPPPQQVAWPGMSYAYNQPPPPYYPPPSPPAQQPRGIDPYAQQLIDTLVGQLNETRREIADMRGQPAPMPVQLPSPPPPGPVAPSPLEQKLDALIGAIGGLVARPVAAGVATGLGAAGMPQTQVSPIEDELRSLTAGLMRTVVKKVASNIQGAIIGDDGAPDAPDTEVPAPPAPEAQKDPKEDLPFQEVRLEGRWGNGSQVIYTPSKDGTGVGGVHLGGFFAENPFVLEKLAEIAGTGINKLTGSVSDAVSRMVAGAAPHVVSRIPPGAVNAGVASVPQPPQPTPQPVQEQPPPPPPDQGTPGGWPKV